MEQKPKDVTSPLLLALCASTVGSSFVFGYHVGEMNAPAQPGFETSPTQVCTGCASESTVTVLWCWIAASLYLSGAVGGLACGYLADTLGRKAAMMANDILAIISAVLLGISKLTNLYFLLVIGRIIAGINCSISSSLPAIYLTEIAPLRLRGAMGSLNTVIVVLGIFIAQVLGQPRLFGNETRWPVLLAFSAAPAVFQLIIMPFCAESPKYLMAIRKDEEAARAALVKLRQTDSVTEEMNSMLDDSANIESNPSERNNGHFWWAVSICLFNHIGQHLCGISAVVFFSSTIFSEQAQMTNEQAVGATLGVGAVFLISAVVSSALVDRLGRRVLMLSGVVGTMTFNILIFVTMHLVIDSRRYHVAAYAAIIFLYLYVFAFALGPASVAWFYTSELFEPSLRGKANTIATTANWLLGFLTSYTFLPLKDCMGEFVFLLYAAMMAVTAVYIYLFAPETKARRCKEIAKELEDRKPRCIR